MKAKELMMEDWVLYGRRYAIVKRIDPSRCDILVRVTPNHDDIVIETYDNIDPIPLTAEILEKNGFKGEGYLILELDEFSYLEYYPFEGRLRKIWHGIDEWNNHSDTKDITFQCHCKYVHELQHALRLCRLNEIADNLKI